MSDPDPRIDKCFEAITQLADLIKQQSQKSSQSAQDASPSPISQPVAQSIPIDAIESRIQEFRYSPEEESTFEVWWSRHEDIFTTDLAEWSDAQKIRLLLRHVTPSIEKTLCDSLAPAKWSEVSLNVVVSKMNALFGDTTSIFDKRRSMLDIRMSTEGIEDVKVLAARVNRLVESAQMASIKPDELKCLVFLHALDLPRYSDIHLHLLKEARKSKSSADSPTTLDDLISTFNHITQLKRDSKAVTESRVVHAVRTAPTSHRSHHQSRHFSPRVSNQTNHARSHSHHSNDHESNETSSDSDSCYRCLGTNHKPHECKYIDSECHNCHKHGHITRACRSKNRRANMITLASSIDPDYTVAISMHAHEIPMRIDTGSDVTIVSENVWKQIGSPPLKRTTLRVACPNGTPLTISGLFHTMLEYKGMRRKGPILVTPSDISVVGRDYISHLEIFQSCKESPIIHDVTFLHKEEGNTHPMSDCPMKEVPIDDLPKVINTMFMSYGNTHPNSDCPMKEDTTDDLPRDINSMTMSYGMHPYPEPITTVESHLFGHSHPTSINQKIDDQLNSRQSLSRSISHDQSTIIDSFSTVMDTFSLLDTDQAGTASTPIDTRSTPTRSSARSPTTVRHELSPTRGSPPSSASPGSVLKQRQQSDASKIKSYV